MPRTLLFLCLMGAAIYAGFSLVSPPQTTLPVQTPAQTEPVSSTPPSPSAHTKSGVTGQPTQKGPNARQSETETTAVNEQEVAGANGVASADVPSAQEEFHHDYGEVSRSAPVHSGPSVDSQLVGYAEAGALVYLLERKNDWIRIVDPRSAKQGWIYQVYVTPKERPNGIGMPQYSEPLEEAALDSPDAQIVEPQQPRPSAKTKRDRKHVSKRKRMGIKFVLRFRRR